MFKKLLTAVAIASGIVISSALPAQAMTWPSDDVFVIGDAKWYITGNGDEKGWDAADVYENQGYLNWPTDMYSYDYFYCGNGNGYYSDPVADYSQSVVTEESNGDISITCPVWEDAWDTYTGLKMQSFVRLYHEEKGGYLERYMTTFTNTTGADITIDDIYLFRSSLDPNAFDSGSGDFITSSGATSLANGDTWSAAGNPDGSTADTLYMSSAWGRTGNGAGLTVDGDVYFYPNDASTIPAGGSMTIVTYTFMVIPATQDAAGTDAAWAAVQAQASEYATFGGRLTCGIPEGTVVEYWGTAPADSCAPPTLPNTGFDSHLVYGSVAALAFGALLTLVAIRRRA